VSISGRLDVIAATVTPFTADGGLDEPAWRALLTRLEPVVDGFFVAGTTGEFPALTDVERLRLLEIALEVAGPERVVLQVGAAAGRQAEGLVRAACAAGATRLAAITPFYLPVSPDAVLQYYHRLATAAAQASGPSAASLYAYFYPDLTQVPCDPTALGRLAEVGVAGVKMSGVAAALIEDYVGNAPPGFEVWSGGDRDLATLARCSASGVVSGVAGVDPWSFIALRDALERADPTVAELDRQVGRQCAALRNIPVLKVALAELGIAGATCRMSVDPATSEDLVAVRAAVGSLPGSVLREAADGREA